MRPREVFGLGSAPTTPTMPHALAAAEVRRQSEGWVDSNNMAPRTRCDLGRTAQGSGVSSIVLSSKQGRSATLQTKVVFVLVGAVNSQAVIPKRMAHPNKVSLRLYPPTSHDWQARRVNRGPI